jgi:hypothetical protein
MSDPRLSLSGYISLSNATDWRRSNLVNELRLQSESDYDPVTDYWKRLREAVKRDRKTMRDGSAVREAAKNATERKRGPFERLARRWDSVIPRWESSIYQPAIKAEADVFGFPVVVSPTFVELHKPTINDVVVVYFNRSPLAQSSINDVLRVVSFANRGQAFRPTLVDLPRGAVHQEITESLEDVDDRLASRSEFLLQRWAA